MIAHDFDIFHNIIWISQMDMIQICNKLNAEKANK